MIAFSVWPRQRVRTPFGRPHPPRRRPVASIAPPVMLVVGEAGSACRAKRKPTADNGGPRVICPSGSGAFASHRDLKPTTLSERAEVPCQV